MGVETKFVLLVGDEETEILKLAPKNDLVETVLNFSQTPSVGVLIEQISTMAAQTADRAREAGIKAGVYATPDKGVLWLHKVMGLITIKE